MAAYEQPIILDSGKNAYTDLSAKQYFFVKETSNGIELCAGATDKPAGILQNQPTAGQPAQIMRLGISKLKLGGTVAVGAGVGTDANGKGDSKTPGTDTTEYIAATAMEAGVNGDLIAVALTPAPFRAA